MRAIMHLQNIVCVVRLLACASFLKHDVSSLSRLNSSKLAEGTHCLSIKVTRCLMFLRGKLSCSTTRHELFCHTYVMCTITRQRCGRLHSFTALRGANILRQSNLALFIE